MQRTNSYNRYLTPFLALVVFKSSKGWIMRENAFSSHGRNNKLFPIIFSDSHPGPNWLCAYRARVAESQNSCKKSEFPENELFVYIQ